MPAIELAFFINLRHARFITYRINKVRTATDKQHQEPSDPKKQGILRFFILPSDLEGKPAAEQAIARHMSSLTGDEKWNDPMSVKTLTLEH